jgi:hypothetical protein
MDESASPKSDANAGAERRAHPRQPCQYVATCLSKGRAWSPVRFVDLSRSGAGVLLLSPIEVGAPVVFSVQMRSTRMLQIRATVRRVQQRAGEWLAGCAFDELLSEKDFAELV